MFALVMAACLAVLLFSNIWILREMEALRSRLRACRDELTLLDNQLCRILAEIRERPRSD